MAADLNIDLVFSEVLPRQKASKIQQLKHASKRVAMVGDDVNDAPALVTTDIVIAIGAGTDVAVEAWRHRALSLRAPNSRSVESSYRKMIQNLARAAGYNVVAICLAADRRIGDSFFLRLWMPR